LTLNVLGVLDYEISKINTQKIKDTTTRPAPLFNKKQKNPGVNGVLEE
jgi:hypothetical protein